MADMKRYEITLTGISPLIMHKDNITFSESVKTWQKNPENKQISVAGDDRSPAWTWIGYCYHDGKHLVMDSDNIMTMLREGGAKVPTGLTRGEKTFKRSTQSGLLCDDICFRLYVKGKEIPIDPLNKLIGNNDFQAHIDTAEKLGFELLTKRAKVNMTKHVRVRPLFREWVASGTITVFDEEQSGLTQEILRRILTQAGSLVGLGDWRPSSSKSSGVYGRFSPEIVEI